MARDESASICIGFAGHAPAQRASGTAGVIDAARKVFGKQPSRRTAPQSASTTRPALSRRPDGKARISHQTKNVPGTQSSTPMLKTSGCETAARQKSEDASPYPIRARP